jgi:hypothetical protein
MVVVPAATPVTIPVEEPTVATGETVLAHVPPLVASVKVIEDPTHTVLLPVIAAGAAVTVSVL